MTDTSPEGKKNGSADRGTLGRAVAGLNALGSVWIIGLMLLIVTDILMRTFANAPIAGTPEMVSFSIVGIVFLQLSHTLRSGSLTRTDMVLNILKVRAPRAHRLLLALFDMAGAALLIVALWQFVPSIEKAWVRPERNFMGNPGFFTVPLWPLYLLIAIGIGATVLQFLASAFRNATGSKAEGQK